MIKKILFYQSGEENSKNRYQIESDLPDSDPYDPFSECIKDWMIQLIGDRPVLIRNYLPFKPLKESFLVKTSEDMNDPFLSRWQESLKQNNYNCEYKIINECKKIGLVKNKSKSLFVLLEGLYQYFNFITCFNKSVRKELWTRGFQVAVFSDEIHLEECLKKLKMDEYLFKAYLDEWTCIVRLSCSSAFCPEERLISGLKVAAAKHGYELEVLPTISVEENKKQKK